MRLLREYMKNSENLMIRNYKEGDEKEIVSLFQEVFGKEMTVEQWKWKYLVPGNGRIYSKVTEAVSHGIIGHAGAIPLRGVFKNNPIHIFQIVDVMVHPKKRGFLGRKNIFDPMIKILFEDIRKEFNDVFCYGFPGSRPFVLGERIKVYERIEQASEDVKRLRRSLMNPYRVQMIDWDDNRLDDLWTRLSINFPLSLSRDKRYLNWRYATNPFFSYQLFGLFLLGKLKGWMVTRDSDNEILIVDLLTEPGRYKGILKAMANHLISKGGKNLHFWLPERWRKNIKGYTVNETLVVVTNMIWKLPFTTSTVKENLYYTMGDADIF
jgi:hypothetical protein